MEQRGDGGRREEGAGAQGWRGGGGGGSWISTKGGRVGEGWGVATGLWVKPVESHDSAEMWRPDQEHIALSY